MNQLITVTNRQIGTRLIPSVNARELHEFLESKQLFANWISNRINQYGFEENVDFIMVLSTEQVFNKIIKNPESLENKGGRPTKEYFIALDMAKELSMVERNEKGRQARKYFIACEQIALAKMQDNRKDTNHLIHNIVITLKEAVRGQSRILDKIATLHGQSLDLQAQTLAILEKQTTHRYRPANAEDYLKVKKWLSEGKSVAFISESLGISKTSVHNIKYGILTVGDGYLLVRTDRKPSNTTINIQA